MATLYVGRYGGTIAPPPVTLVQQTVVINRYTNVAVVNVSGGMTVVGGSITVGGVNVSRGGDGRPDEDCRGDAPGDGIAPLPMEARRHEAVAAREMRRMAADRMRHENDVVRRGGGIPRGAADVHSMRIEGSRRR